MMRFDTTPQGRTPAWLLCSLPLALAACDTAGGPSTTLEVDSAGIPITTALAPVWGPGDEWTISEEPVVQIGRVDGPAEYLLGSVSRAVRLSNGDIVLGDWSNNVLRRYDREGVFVWEASRQGEGPGEHLRLLWVGALASDSIVTWDGALRRVQIFGPDGVVGRTFRVEAPWSDFAPSAVQGIWGRNLVMSFHDYRGEMPEGVVRWPGVRYATVSMDDGEVARLIDVAGGEQEITSYPGGQVAYTGYQYGKGPLSTVQAGALAVVDTEAFSIRSISLRDGSTSRILRRDEPLVPVTEEHMDAFLDWMVWRNQVWGGMSEAQAEARRPAWRDLPMAPTLPVLSAIHLDMAGNLWVRPYSLPLAESLPYEVYAPDGTWLGHMATPPGLRLGDGEIGEDYLLGVWMDEQDVQYVRMYRLEK
ncbi:MAG: hypothetical protein F4107_14780 [Gemmatimonadetes bacterium]|nr:hypothetical protein [Gemmatimonadota bacterium]MYD14805.1 hypothetical protein [Gemmatimonadota bacterium]MYI67182.1 hypothetical protein [Gemmatimonadota bacterium]